MNNESKELKMFNEFQNKITKNLELLKQIEDYLLEQQTFNEQGDVDYGDIGNQGKINSELKELLTFIKGE